MNEPIRIAVIGGGAAGMMAAIHAATYGADVTLLEKMNACGKKLRITGKGRCNVTNDCTLEEFLQNVPTNPRFLYGALSFFSTEDTMRFFENVGVPLKVERGRRVFPKSDHAEDIVRAMTEECRALGVKFCFDKVEGLVAENGKIIGVQYADGIVRADRVIVCTGGASYPRTGSDGDGYRFAKVLGHSVTPLRPSLVPIVSHDKICAEMQGLSLKNVALRITEVTSGKLVYEDFGEMMFTQFGVTGPMILSA